MKSQNQFFFILTHHKEHQIKTKQQQKQLSQYVFKLLHYGAILHNVPKDTIFMRLKKKSLIGSGNKWDWGSDFLFLYVLLSPL